MAGCLFLLFATGLGAGIAALGTHDLLGTALVFMGGIVLAALFPTRSSLVAAPAGVVMYYTSWGLAANVRSWLGDGWFWPAIMVTAATFGFGLACLSAVISRRYRPIVRDPERCAKCGYLLFGLPEHRCPECGTPSTVESLTGGLPPP